MGTRSLVKFFDAKDKPFFCMYRQFDGYPSGAGMEYKEFLDKFTILNGYSSTDKWLANGMNCLAAQFVAHFKTGIGGFYIYHANSHDVGEEYIYEVRQKGNKAVITCLDTDGKQYEITDEKGE